MSKHRPNHTRPVFSAQLREAIWQVTQPHLPLEIDGRELDAERMWEILTYASVNQLTMESACHELHTAPSGNTVRAHLAEALDDDRAQVVALEEQLNEALWAQLPRRVPLCARMGLDTPRL